MFANRSVVELMVIVFTGLVAMAVVVGTVTVLIVEIRDPAADTSQITDALSSIITGILGALLGLLAGKSEAIQQTHERPTE